MILTFDEYNALKESEQSANIYEELLLRIMEQLEEGSLTHNIFIENVIEISKEYELDEEFNFSEFFKENESYFEITINEDSEDEYIISLTEQGQELFELGKAQGRLHQTARSARGAFDAITGKEKQKKWYDTLGSQISKGVTNFQKQKTKQKKLDIRSDQAKERQARKDIAAQRKYDLKMAKLQAAK